jgi:hypothetical protein
MRVDCDYAAFVAKFVGDSHQSSTFSRQVKHEQLQSAATAAGSLRNARSRAPS